jgi:hypothetical protein
MVDLIQLAFEFGLRPLPLTDPTGAKRVTVKIGQAADF